MSINIPTRVLREVVTFAKNASIEKLILFGSRARGTNRNKNVSKDLQDEIAKDGVTIYETNDNFVNCLEILKTADFNLVNSNDIYRMGVIGQFNLTFELAWKALKAVLEEDGVSGAETGSARDILKLAASVI